MAIRPDWNVGTITLTANSANFTTTAAMLTTSAAEPGDMIITPSGSALIIATITGQNSGTLMLPCPSAAAGANLPLRIRFQPDGSRFQAAFRLASALFTGGNVEALANLPGEAGKMPVFTGPGALELRDYLADPNGSLAGLSALTLAARQILQADANGKLSALTLAARQILQTDANGALKAIALAANKFLYTDANADIKQSDITAAAIAFMNLAGAAAADKLPYFTGPNGAGLADLSSLARSVLAATTESAMFSAMGVTNGTGWIRFPTGHKFVFGTAVVITDTGAVAGVTLPSAFSSAGSYIVVAWNGDYNNTGYIQHVRSGFWPQASGFAVQYRDVSNGALLTSSMRRVDFLAMGT